VAQKESVNNIHKKLQIFTVPMLLIKALLVAALLKSQVTRVALAGQSQALRLSFDLLVNSFEMTDGLQPDS
jgi:hypothetical protein